MQVFFIVLRYSLYKQIEQTAKAYVLQGFKNILYISLVKLVYMEIVIYFCAIQTDKDMKETKLFIVLNEETLNTMKGKGGKTAKFKTEQEADNAASGKLNMWSVLKVHFTHEWLIHEV
jgi:hypothetical protein